MLGVHLRRSMKDENILRDFVRQNLTLLTSERFDRRQYKDAVKDFYIRRHRKKFSFPPNKDCMAMLITLLKGRIDDSKIIQLIDTLPFFRETGERERQSLKDSVISQQIQSVLTSDEIKSIDEIGAYEAVSLHKGLQIEAEKQRELQHLQNQIDAKRDEYESFPTVLDAENIPEPALDPDEERIKPWWQRLYLKEDPFPQKDGLSAWRDPSEWTGLNCSSASFSWFFSAGFLGCSFN